MWKFNQSTSTRHRSVGCAKGSLWTLFLEKKKEKKKQKINWKKIFIKKFVIYVTKNSNKKWISEHMKLSKRSMLNEVEEEVEEEVEVEIDENN